jgi:uncharacterized protein YbbK (DUF523 family)
MSSPQPRPRVGISSCLLGSCVRYDGGHKRSESLLETLGSLVEWVPVCPEVDIGLGTPRPPIRLERDGEESIRLVMPETGEDLTDRMTRYATERTETLREKGISGYVLKSRSPSCGIEGVPVHETNGEGSTDDLGVFAAVLRKRMPHLPVEDEERLMDPDVLNNFIARIYATARWLEHKDAGTQPGAEPTTGE